MKRSYTIVELLIFMGMLSILLIFLTDVLGSILDVRRDTESISAVQQDGNYILNRFIFDIARASSINTPPAIGLHNPILDISIGADNYIYSINNGNLTLQVNGGAITPLNSLSTQISLLDFYRIGNIPPTPTPADGKDTIQIEFTITSRIKKASGIDTKNFQTTVGLR